MCPQQSFLNGIAVFADTETREIRGTLPVPGAGNPAEQGRLGDRPGSSAAHSTATHLPGTRGHCAGNGSDPSPPGPTLTVAWRAVRGLLGGGGRGAAPGDRCWPVSELWLQYLPGPGGHCPEGGEL